MEFRLLGPVEVWNGDHWVALGGPKPRALLAALLLRAGQVVSVDRLVHLVWGAHAPDTARGLVQTYVSALRRKLGGDLIETRPPGYLVRLDRGVLDVRAFEQLADDARRAVAEARHEDAARSLRAAERLWRGPALDGVGEALSADVARLTELRLTVVDERIAVELQLGRQSEVVAELTSLVAAHPARERMRGHLMTALYRLGRSSEALAVYEDGRKALAEELGIDPGPDLRALHQAILREDVAVLGFVPLAQPAMEEHGRVIPAQLPADVPDLVGRAALIAGLTPLLDINHTAPPVLVISGKGGVGKSAVAVHLARQAGYRYPDGQLFADLRGTTDSPATAEEVLSRFLRALGIPYTAQPESAQDRADLYRSLLAQRRVLLVLDDARSEQQIRPLLPGGTGCAVLITSRGRLAGLASAHLTDLDVLDTEGALALLGSILGADRLAAEPDAAAEIVRLCGLLPLAVRTAGARLATRRHWTLATMAGRLGVEHRRLDELVAGDVAVRASVGLSYRLLDQQAQTAFRRLGLLGTPDFPSWIVAPLLDIPADDADDVVERLVDAQLVDHVTIDAVGQSRFRLHDLLRVFAAECSEVCDTAAERDAAITRTLGSWLQLIIEVGSRVPSGEVELRRHYASALPVDDHVARRVVADPEAWLEAETPALIVAVGRAACLDLDVAACDLATALSFFRVFSANRLAEWHSSHAAALAATRRAGNRLGEAALLAGLGQIHYSLDHFDQVREHLSQALTIFIEAGDRRGEAVALAGLGGACREQCRLREGLGLLSRSAELFRLLGDDIGIGATCRLSATIHLELGEYDATWPLLDQALTAYRSADSGRGEALTVRTRSLVHRALGDYAQAERDSTEALAMLRASGEQLMIAFAVQSWAKVEIRQGRGAACLPSMVDALDVCRNHLDRYGEALMLRTIGELHLAEGELDLAEAHLIESIAISQELGTALPAARARRDLAAVLAARGDSAAEAMLATALEIFSEHEAREFAELTHPAAARLPPLRRPQTTELERA
ncbi:BTAD domain-containing putative transcriptional regulator [Nonomuraea sp. NPDC049141]|uniref:AfsR/SARP family transcriptional regulator n=1 Tax=unclassified Nonomuraea TaxID=2593643 RepID=UPI0033FC13C5